MGKLLSSAILTGILAGSTVTAFAQKDVQEAIRWERAKDRAAARQAAKVNSGKSASTGEADRTVAAEPVKKPSGVEEAIRFERFKEQAAARQARKEAKGEAARTVRK